MELNPEYLNTLKQKGKHLKRITNSEQSLASEAILFFGTKLKFGQVMRFIKIHGEQKVREAFEHVKKSDACNNPIAVFLWRCKNG